MSFFSAQRAEPCRYSFAFELLEKTGVAVTPGIDFGPRLEGYVRISYANAMENLSKGLDRLADYLKTLSG